jgi:hypothetical protein
MFSDLLEEVEVHKIAAAVHKSAMAWVKEHEIKYVEGRTENSQFRDLKNLRAISEKWKNIIKPVSESDDCKALGGLDTWLKRELGKIASSGTQRKLTHIYKMVPKAKKL